MTSENHVLVFGAGSGIALATARILVKKGWRATLVNRSKIDGHELEKFQADKIREIVGVDFSKSSCACDEIKSIISGDVFTHIIVAQGFMLESHYLNNHDIIKAYNCNLVSVALILNEIYSISEKSRSVEQIVVLGSVAGDRGKEKNPVYDSSKAGLETLCQGFRQRFNHLNINLILIKPGNVRTKMTAEKSKNWLWVDPFVVAVDIVSAMNNKRDVVYTPWFWRYVMLIIRLMPEKIFVGLGLGKVN